MLIIFVECHMQNHFRLTLAGYIAGFGEEKVRRYLLSVLTSVGTKGTCTSHCHHIMQADCAFGADCGLPANTS
jgi:hypothetical protein